MSGELFTFDRIATNIGYVTTNLQNKTTVTVSLSLKNRTVKFLWQCQFRGRFAGTREGMEQAHQLFKPDVATSLITRFCCEILQFYSASAKYSPLWFRLCRRVGALWTLSRRAIDCCMQKDRWRISCFFYGWSCRAGLCTHVNLTRNWMSKHCILAASAIERIRLLLNNSINEI